MEVLMLFGLDFEKRLRAALVEMGWRLLSNKRLDHEAGIDFIVVGHGERYWHTRIEVQLTFRARSLEKLLDFLDTSASRQNDNVKVYIVLAGSPAVEPIARTINNAFVRKIFKSAAPNGTYLLEVDERCVGYWREPLGFAAKLRDQRKAALANDGRKRGIVIRLLESAFVIRCNVGKSRGKLFFARFSDVAESNAPERSVNNPARVGDIVTFMPTEAMNAHGQLLAEYVYIKHPRTE